MAFEGLSGWIAPWIQNRTKGRLLGTDRPNPLPLDKHGHVLQLMHTLARPFDVPMAA